MGSAHPLVCQEGPHHTRSTIAHGPTPVSNPNPNNPNTNPDTTTKPLTLTLTAGAEPFPQSAWGAQGIGYLTDHGTQVLTSLGAFLRERWVEDASLLPDDCDAALSALTLYSDNDASDTKPGTQRDYHTTMAIMKGLFPSCNFSSAVNIDRGYVQPLFNDGSHSATLYADKPACLIPGEQDYLGTIGGSAARISEQHSDWVQALNDAIGCCKPSLCGAGASACNLMNLTTTYSGNKTYYAPWSGPLFNSGWGVTLTRL